MRDALIIFVSLILAVAIGGYLFLYGAPPPPSAPAAPELSFGGEEQFVVLAEGSDAGTLTRRTNYRIKTDEELIALWELVYPRGGTAIPLVDFTKHEVIAVFDGSHSTGGYAVTVSRIVDADGQRTVYLSREEPGETCSISQGTSNPFQIVRVEKTTLPITREEAVVVNECR